MTAPGADVDRHAQALVAGLLDGLDAAAAHVDIESDVLGNVHRAGARAEVAGGGRKPYRQKGTGRARQGSIRAPQFVGGGVVHGPQPRSY